MARGRSLVSIGVKAYDLLYLIYEGYSLAEARKLLSQKYTQQTHTLNQLLNSDCIVRSMRGKYYVTDFGKYILIRLRKKREKSLWK